jgi:protein gp37
MSDKTSIEWTSATWGITRGCARVSAGCGDSHGGGCYAERMAHRFAGPGQPFEGLTRLTSNGPRWTGEARFVSSMLGLPLTWRKPRRIFVSSMSDLFHDDITNEQIAAVFGVMAMCPQHTFQVLTKRPQRMVKWFDWTVREHSIDHAVARWVGIAAQSIASGVTDAFLSVLRRHWDPLRPVASNTRDLLPLPNVHLGVSTENQEAADERIPILLQVPAAVRFVSAEPLLGPIDFDLPRCDACGEPADSVASDGATPWCSEHDNECSYGHWLDFIGDDGASANGGISWIIAGGESGPGSRGCSVDWIDSIVKQCVAAGTAVFVKQLGAHPFEEREADGGSHGSTEALASLGAPHPQRRWFPSGDGWCLTHTPDGRSRWIRGLRLLNRKGGDMAEWPTHLQIRQFPEVTT